MDKLLMPGRNMSRIFRAKTMCNKKTETGGSLIELMIGVLILAIGLGALTTLFIGSVLTNNRNNKDTSATLLAQKVIEELTAQDTNSTATVNLTDCNGNNWQFPSTQGAAYPRTRRNPGCQRR